MLRNIRGRCSQDRDDRRDQSCGRKQSEVLGTGNEPEHAHDKSTKAEQSPGRICWIEGLPERQKCQQSAKNAADRRRPRTPPPFTCGVRSCGDIRSYRFRLVTCFVLVRRHVRERTVGYRWVQRDAANQCAGRGVASGEGEDRAGMNELWTRLAPATRAQPAHKAGLVRETGVARPAEPAEKTRMDIRDGRVEFVAV